MEHRYSHISTDHAHETKNVSENDQEQPDNFSEAGSSTGEANPFEANPVKANATNSNSAILDEPITEYTLTRTTKITTRPLLSQSPSLQHISGRQVQLIQHWRREIIACVIFILAILAIVETLYLYHGKLIPKWPSWISISSLISIYVVLLKTAILLVTAEGISQLKWAWFKEGRPLQDLAYYGSASRGPRVALILVCKLRTRHFLSSSGALITIMALAIDPFTQQVTRCRDSHVALDNIRGTIPRTNLYIGHVYHDGAETETVVPALQDAVDAFNAGIFSPVVLVSHECLTGNCTFPQEYGIVGYCSNCENVTDELIFSDISYNDIDTIQNGSNPYNVTYNHYNLTSSLPSGLYLQHSPWSGRVDVKSIRTSGATRKAEVEFILGKGSGFNTAEDEYDNAAGNNTWRPQGYGASRCSLYLCFRSYRATVTAGALQETSMSYSSDWVVTQEPSFGPLCYAALNAYRKTIEPLNLRNYHEARERGEQKLLN